MVNGVKSRKEISWIEYAICEPRRLNCNLNRMGRTFTEQWVVFGLCLQFYCLVNYSTLSAKHGPQRMVNKACSGESGVALGESDQWNTNRYRGMQDMKLISGINC